MVNAEDASSDARGALNDSLKRVASRLQGTRALRRGDIMLRLTGAAGGNYRLSYDDREVQVVETSSTRADAPPLIEVMGDADVIRNILDRERDAREQFLAGGMRVRGDLQYLSDVALELGLLKEPL